MGKVTHKFIVKGKPKVKGRPRFSKHGHAYTDARTREAEQIIKDSYLDSSGPIFTTPVHLEIVFFNDKTEITITEMDCGFSSLRGDLDNYVKAVMDALHDVAFGNDKIVQEITAVKMPKIGGPK